jgi:cation-transporting P-type ATPase 13A2
MLVISLTVLSAFSLYCLFATSGFIFDILGLVSFPQSFHWVLFAMVVVNTIACFLFESYAARPVTRGIKATQRLYARLRYGRSWRDKARHRNHESKLYKAVAAGMARDGHA